MASSSVSPSTYLDFSSEESRKMVEQLRSVDPDEYDRQLAEQAEAVKSSQRVWQRLRTNGITLEYLQIWDESDPELMERNELITFEQAALRHPNAIAAYEMAQERIRNASRKGAQALQAKSDELTTFLLKCFPNLPHRLQHGLSVLRAEQYVRNQMKVQRLIWVGFNNAINGPCSRTLRKALTRIKVGKGHSPTI